jgi:hypothetical protein
MVSRSAQFFRFNKKLSSASDPIAQVFPVRASLEIPIDSKAFEKQPEMTSRHDISCVPGTTVITFFRNVEAIRRSGQPEKSPSRVPDFNLRRRFDGEFVQRKNRQLHKS